MTRRKTTTENLAKVWLKQLVGHCSLPGPIASPRLSATFARLLLLGMIALAACNPAADAPPKPTPTIYYAPATPAVYAPPAPLPSTHPAAEPVTVLLMGVDRRSTVGGTNNTDTLLLFYLDPVTQRAAMLSIPRDLYVDIPGHGQNRINTAYAYGERDGTGGLTLARQTVSATVGIPVDHAVLIDFAVFVTVVDAIGGIDVDVPYDIYDPTYPDSGIGYDPFYISAGSHHLDGTTALKYARTRATAGGDFDRTARQRQVVMAVRNRVLSLDLLPSLIAQSPQLWANLQGTFEADLTLSEMIDLAVTASHIPTDQIATGSIDDSCTLPWTTPSGAQVLLPLPDVIDDLVSDLISSGSTSASAK
jgi:LCP family protein required for cell wall assembly